MKKTITLPKLGESITEATVVAWRKKIGEEVALDEPLVEVATDKINSEIPSPCKGILTQQFAQPGDLLQVGDSLAEVGSASNEQQFFSPAVLRLAKEKNLSLSELEKMSGTGIGGRVTKKDLEAFSLKESSKSKASFHTPMRKAIAQNLLQSYQNIPHATLLLEVDVEDLMRDVKAHKELFLQKFGAKLTVTSCFAYALCQSLRKFPLVHSRWEEQELVQPSHVDLGIAVAVEEGVWVPVIFAAETQSLPGLARAIASFAKKAKEQKLSANDIQQGTITLTNFGIGGVQVGFPIIRYPEAAILATGAVEKRVCALKNGAIAVRSQCTITFSFDHRVFDGMYASHFLGCFKQNIESLSLAQLLVEENPALPS